MSTLAQLRKAVPPSAVIIDEKIGQSHSCDVDAPPGMVWKALGCHCLVDSAYPPWKPDYAHLLKMVNGGTEACTTPDCEWCADTMEEVR